MWVTNLVAGGGSLQHYGSASSPTETYVFGRFGSNLLRVSHGDGTSAFNFTNGGDTSQAGFVVAYSQNGTALWAVRVNSPAIDVITGAAVSPQGNLYVIGTCGGLLTFFHRNGSAARNVQLNGDTSATFVAKYDSAGTVLWAVSYSYGYSTFDIGATVSVDALDNAYVIAPVFPTPIRVYDPANVNIKNVSTSAWGWENIAAKYNPSGVLQWTAIIGGPDNDLTRSAVIDPSSNQFLVGGWYNSAQHTHFNSNGGIGARLTDGTGTFFHCQYARYSASGTVAWASGTNGTAECRVYQVAADSAGSSLVTGFILGTTSFRHSNGSIFRTSSISGVGDAFLISTTSTGVIRWVAVFGGSGAESCFSVVADSSNNVIAACSSTSTTITINHANGSIAMNLTASSLSRFLVKYSPTGIALWAAVMDGSQPNDLTGIAVDAGNNIYATIQYNAKMTLYNANGAIAKIFPAPTGNSIFIAKYRADGYLTLNCTAGFTPSSTDCVPCPVNTFKSAFGTEPCTPCPDGRGTTNTGSTSAMGCDFCLAGYYGAAPNCVACSAGSYCPFQYATTQADCPAGKFCANTTSLDSCQLGDYCPPRSTARNPCPPGSFCETASTISNCTLGSHCPAGSISQNQCPAGSYCLDSSLITDCAIGDFCPPGITSKNLCPAGSFCTNASTISTCALGSYCPEGRSSQQPCPLGSFCPNTTTSIACTLGSHCPSGSISQYPCPAGSYCVNPSSIANCALGSFCVSGQTAEKDCPAGFSCSSTTEVAPCPLNSYCPARSTVPLSCPEGYQCPTPAHQLPCGNGKYCPLNTSAPNDCPDNSGGSVVYGARLSDCGCNSGYFRKNATFCLECPKGTFCGFNSTSPTMCANGKTTLSTKSTTVNDCVCDVGFAGQSTCAACQNGFFTPAEGSKDCNTCPSEEDLCWMCGPEAWTTDRSTWNMALTLTCRQCAQQSRECTGLNSADIQSETNFYIGIGMLGTSVVMTLMTCVLITIFMRRNQPPIKMTEFSLPFLPTTMSTMTAMRSTSIQAGNVGAYRR